MPTSHIRHRLLMLLAVLGLGAVLASGCTPPDPAPPSDTFVRITKAGIGDYLPTAYSPDGTTQVMWLGQVGVIKAYQLLQSCATAGDPDSLTDAASLDCARPKFLATKWINFKQEDQASDRLAFTGKIAGDDAEWPHFARVVVTLPLCVRLGMNAPAGQRSSGQIACPTPSSVTA